MGHESNTQNAPAIRFSNFHESWKREKLGDTYQFKNGINADKEKYGRGTKFINVLDVINNQPITYDSILSSVEVTATEFERYKVNYGDILFQRSSETREEAGQANIYLDPTQQAVFGGFVIRATPQRETCPLFQNYLLKTTSARKEITSKSGGSTRYNVGQDILSNVEVTTPSLPEQEKIASFLSDIDAKIENLTQQSACMQQYKKGCMQKLFSQEIRFKDDEGNAFPDWEEKKLGEVCTTFKSGSGITSERISSEGNFPVYGGNGLRGYTDNYTHDGKYVLIGRQGALCGNINCCEGKSYISEHAIAAQGNERTSTDWLSQRLAFFNLNKLSESSAQPGLSVANLKNLKLLFPSLPEQQKNANFLSSIDEKIEALNKQLNVIKEFKKGLLQGMFV